MATAPDPKKVAAQLAAEKAAEEAAKLKAEREKLVAWLFLAGERRVLRDVDIRGTHVRRLRVEAEIGPFDVWPELLRGAACPLDSFVAGWWLAGMQAGVVGESFAGLLEGVSHADEPWVHYPSDEELATDGGDPYDPPA